MAILAVHCCLMQPLDAAVELQELDQDEFSAAVLSDYDSLDVAVDVSIDKNAWFPDLGSVSDTNHERLTNLMRSDGFDVVSARLHTANASQSCYAHASLISNPHFKPSSQTLIST